MLSARPRATCIRSLGPWLAAIAAVAGTGPVEATPELAGFTDDGARVQRRVEERLAALPSAAAFRAHLERITLDPHPFGSEANARVADYLARVMEGAGLEVARHEYDVYAPVGRPGVSVALVRPLRLPLNNQEYVLDEDPYSAHPAAGPGWNAYAATGDVTAEVVYANYGRREDFQKLAAIGVPLEGRIVLARYGGNYRGYKAKYAEEAGAAGLVIYSDPANGGFANGPVYPEGPHWNESTVQRGSIKTLPYPGDPLTPGEPALPLDSGRVASRLDPEEVALPRIPVTPLPYGSAAEILRRMEGDPVPKGWQGGLPFTYRLTGGPGLTVRLRVEQPCGWVRATDVVGRLRGAEVPDQWVILGCHYDAWTFGAADPNGGTAMLLTLAEALGELARQGHRPRRSILICHWDAEEFGIIGSTEWVEELRRDLAASAVAYINADMCVTGPRFGAAASPTLKGPIVEAARAVAHPDDDRTVYEHWLPAAGEDREPAVGNLGGGSDHVAFYTHVGIPAAALGMGGPSLYHSLYDSFAFFERFCDPQFAYGPAMARIDGILALRLANADLLPYDVGRYGADLALHVASLEKRAAELEVAVRLDSLRRAVADLGAATGLMAAAREAYLDRGSHPLAELTDLNRQLLALERGLLHEEGLQYNSWGRSLYAGPDPFSGYACWLLPGIRYELEAGDAAGVAQWEAVYVDAVDRLAAQTRELLAALGAAP